MEPGPELSWSMMVLSPVHRRFATASSRPTTCTPMWWRKHWTTTRLPASLNASSTPLSPLAIPSMAKKMAWSPGQTSASFTSTSTPPSGLPYHCDASSGGGIGLGFGKRKRQMGMSSSYTPAINGTVSAKGAAVAQAIMDGLHDSKGRRAYISYQPSSSFSDAETSYNSATDSYELNIASTGGEWITRFLELRDADNLSTLDNVTYDTLRDWMELGWKRYEDVLQTTWADLSKFHSAGGKILTFHGESDQSIPTGSLVHFYESIRGVMYPHMKYNEPTTALGDWYRLFLVPGASHCSTNSAQANGPFPQTNLAVMINWVENEVTPETLNATHLAGENQGRNAQLCAWPLRPYWADGEKMECMYDQASIDTWKYDFDAYDMSLY